MADDNRPFWPIAILENGRWTFRDLWSWIQLPDPNPQPDVDEETGHDDPFRTIVAVEPEPEDLPIDVLRKDAKKLGVKILDLRGVPRKMHYYFRNHCVVIDGKVHNLTKKETKKAKENPDYGEVVDWGIWGVFADRKKKRRGETEEHFQAERKKNQPLRGRARGEIGWDGSTTSVIHTMDVEANGPRMLGMPVQSGIEDSADIVLCQPIHAKMWAAHAANGYSSSMEVSGRKGAATDLQIEAGRILLRYEIMEKQRHVERQRYVAPHAFSHWSRKGDPGRLIWDGIAVWGMENLDLKLGPVVGSGKQPKWVTGSPVRKRDM